MTDPDDPTPADLPEPAAGDVFERILWFMEQARRREFRVGPLLKVEGVLMQIVDTRQSQPERVDDGPGIWELAGHKED